LLFKRGVAQLVARAAGGREVAGSSPVTPTKIMIKNPEDHFFSKEAKTYEFMEVKCSECGQIFYKEGASSIDEIEAEDILNTHVGSCAGAVSMDKKEYTN
jgi:hypothetical protein